MTVKIKVNKKTNDVERIIVNIGQSDRCTVEPTFGYKLRRFMKRLRRELSYQADVVCGHIVGSEQAASIPYIGIESHNERW